MEFDVNYGVECTCKMEIYIYITSTGVSWLSAKDQSDVHSSRLEVMKYLEMNACCCFVIRLAASRVEERESWIIDSII